MASKIGVPQGFIHFGSQAHAILLHASLTSRFSVHTCMEEFDLTGSRAQRTLNNTLRKMVAAKFTYVVGFSRVDTGKKYAVYSLQPPRRPVQDLPALSSYERTRLSRARQRVKVPSIFEWRGQISLKDAPALTGHNAPATGASL
jgi:hypothetical protein